MAPRFANMENHSEGQPEIILMIVYAIGKTRHQIFRLEQTDRHVSAGLQIQPPTRREGEAVGAARCGGGTVQSSAAMRSTRQELRERCHLFRVAKGVARAEE